MATTPTSNPIPSEDPRDLKFNAGKIDEEVSGSADYYTDRFGVQRLTSAGRNNAFNAQLAEQQGEYSDLVENLIPLSRQYMTLEAAQADIANIPDGSATYVRSADGSSLADEYINNGGTLEATGRRMVSEEGVNAQFDKINERIFNTPPNIGEYAASVEFPSGRHAPFMNSSGRLVYIDENGSEQLAAADSDIITKPYITAQSMTLPDGAVCTKVVFDPTTNHIVEAWTEDGGYYFATPTGLKRVGNISPVAQNVSYATGTTTALFLSYGATRISADDDDEAGTVIYILPTWGQSLAQGWTTATTDTLIATTNLYPENMFMFASSRGDGKENPNRDSLPIDSIVPLKETINGGWHETACSSSAAHIIKAVEDMTGRKINILRYVAAEGGKAYRDLTRGTASWDALVQGLIDAKRVCEQMGYRPVVLGLDVKAGETDTDGTARMYPELYARYLMNLDHNFNAEVRRIFGGQHPPAHLYVEQCSWQPNGPWDSRVRQGQLDADGIGNIRFTGASYQYDHTGDVIHINSRGQNSRGVQLARAVVFEAFGTGFIPLKAKSAYWSGENTIDVECLTSAAITKDTSGTIINPTGLGNGGGFRIRKRTGDKAELNILSAVVQSAVQPAIIRITVDNPDNEQRVEVGYALAETGEAHQAGPVVGARGLFRTNSGITNLYTGAVEYQYLPAFLMEVI